MCNPDAGDKNLMRHNSKPAVLVIGADGFLGRHLFQQLQSSHISCTGTSHRAKSSHLFLDLSAADSGFSDLNSSGITHAIIAAGIAGIAACEQDPCGTRKVNVDGIVTLAGNLIRQGIRVIAFSSDYVFDGKEGNYDDNATPCPVNEYGRQRSDLERGLLAYGEDCLVLRLSKVYDLNQGSGTLLDEMMHRLWCGEHIHAAHNQTFCPTYIGDLVHGIRHLLKSSASGIINFCSPLSIDRYSLGLQVAKALHVDLSLVHPCTLQDLDESFIRPQNTSLSCRRLPEFITMHCTDLSWSVNTLARKYKNYGSMIQ